MIGLLHFIVDKSGTNLFYINEPKNGSFNDFLELHKQSPAVYRSIKRESFAKLNLE